MAAITPVNTNPPSSSLSVNPEVDQRIDRATQELAQAVFANNEERVTAALTAGANPNGLEVRGGTQQPIFFRAACHGSAPIVTLLIKAKALINQRGPDGRTALYAAVSGANAPVVKCLLDAKADPELGLYNSEMTPLQLAEQMIPNWPVPSLAIVTLLTAAGAAENLEINRPLQQAPSGK